MARKAAAPKHVDPENESQESPDDEGGTPVTAIRGGSVAEPAAGGSMTKTDAVRRALASGNEGPEEGTRYIRDEFGMDVSKALFSATKSRLKGSAGAEPAKRGRKPGSTNGAKRGPKPRIAELAQVVEAIQPAVGKSVVADLAAVKALVEKLGVEEVVEIAKLFG